MRLISITANLHSFNGALDWRSPTRVRLAFSDGSAVRVRVDGDGESVILDDLPLDAPFDMGQYGRIEAHDLCNQVDPLLLESEIATLNAIHSVDDRIIGLAVQRNEGIAFCLWNYGDDLYYGNFDEFLAYDWGTRARPMIGPPITLDE